MARETRTDKQLRLIGEAVALLAAASVPCWLRGGWAIDFFLGEITRPHEDVDVFAWGRDSDDLAACLAQAGFEEIGGPPPHTQRNFVKEGEVFHIALLEQTSAGKLVTPGGRWTQFGGDAAPEEWPAKMLDDSPGRLGDLVVPIVEPASLLHEKESAALIPGHTLTEKHRNDIERLRTALAKHK